VLNLNETPPPVDSRVNGQVRVAAEGQGWERAGTEALMLRLLAASAARQAVAFSLRCWRPLWPRISQLPAQVSYPSCVAGDHYIQAALMGRWGDLAGKVPRERTIAVRMKQSAKTFQTTPENVGKENNLYP
jgi:hypothetical protein